MKDDIEWLKRGSVTLCLMPLWWVLIAISLIATLGVISYRAWFKGLWDLTIKRIRS